MPFLPQHWNLAKLVAHLEKAARVPTAIRSDHSCILIDACLADHNHSTPFIRLSRKCRNIIRWTNASTSKN